MIGAVLMIVCIAMNFHGSSVSHFWASLLILGVGWNFMFIAGTSLLTETYSSAESARAQAFNDFTVFSAAALASFSAGALLHQWGWQLVNYAVAPLIVLVVLAHAWLWLSNKRRPVATGH